MPLADNTEESADDMTAAATAPSPKKDTTVGHKYCITNGKTYRPSLAGSEPFITLVYDVAFQSVKNNVKQLTN